jgi:cytochrome c
MSLRLLLVAVGVALATGARAQTGGDPTAGQDLFLDRCAMCHVAEGGGQGPSLTGLYGRKAGSVAGFAYSAALKASGVTWTGPELDRFLANPQVAIPGTAMPILVSDPKERANLISFFAAQH